MTLRPRTPVPLLLMLSLVVVGGAACTTGASPSESGSPAASDECPFLDAMSCEGLRVRRCERHDGVLRWGDASPCEDDAAICRDDACRPLNGDETARLEAIGALLDESRRFGATARPVDYETLAAALREALLLGDGSERTYARVLWRGMLAIPQGHQALALSPTENGAAYERAGLAQGSLTRYGACLRPYGDHAVVTIADGRTTPLRAGDEIVAVDGERGDAFYERFVATPLAMDYLPPTKAGRIAFATRSFFSVDHKGVVLTVRSGESEEEHDVTLPSALPPSAGVGCDDAFGRDYTKPATATLLDDGTGVLYVPSFLQTSEAAFERDVLPEFQKVKDAPRLVIDVRGNGGGRLLSALALVGGFPAAVKTAYCEFFERRVGSNPPAYFSQGVRTVEPVETFAYHGKLAVLVDGATHSAADHLALAAKLATSALIVGTPTAGAYGKVNHDTRRELMGHPKLSVSMNRSQVRAMDGTVLEGMPLEPNVIVEYEPSSLARGADPMLERAVSELRR